MTGDQTCALPISQKEPYVHALAENTPLASTPDGERSSFKACTYGSFWGAKVPNIPLLWSTEMPKNIYEIMNSQCNALMHKKDVITN